MVDRFLFILINFSYIEYQTKSKEKKTGVHYKILKNNFNAYMQSLKKAVKSIFKIKSTLFISRRCHAKTKCVDLTSS